MRGVCFSPSLFALLLKILYLYRLCDWIMYVGFFFFFFGVIRKRAEISENVWQNNFFFPLAWGEKLGFLFVFGVRESKGKWVLTVVVGLRRLA